MNTASALWLTIMIYELTVFSVDIPIGDLWFSHHSTMWKRLTELNMDSSALAMRLIPCAVLIPALTLSVTRNRAIQLGSLIFGIPFLVGPIFNFWAGYLFNCCSFWHKGAGEALSEADGLAKFQKSFARNHHILPKIEGHVVFVDTEHTILMVLVLLAFAFSLARIFSSATSSKKGQSKKSL